MKSFVLTLAGNALNFAGSPTFQIGQVGEAEDPDYIVVLRRASTSAYSQIPDLPVIGEIRRQGVLFAAIYSRRKM